MFWQLLYSASNSAQTDESVSLPKPALLRSSFFITVTADWRPFSNSQHNTTQHNNTTTTDPANTQVDNKLQQSIKTYG